jgi:hypothetical protein
VAVVRVLGTYWEGGNKSTQDLQVNKLPICLSHIDPVCPTRRLSTFINVLGFGEKFKIIIHVFKYVLYFKVQEEDGVVQFNKNGFAELTSMS